ncbi:hypothetical protein BC829DRAFT_382346 [Chytridium lagenaria]|nr:hypothetical protein BC829DRAFT_382346 [Chytridium lagenaria]
MPLAASLASLSKDGSKSTELNYSSGRLDSDYTEKDWSFSHTRLITSLLAPQDNDIEDWAISLHSFFVAYAGITSSNNSGDNGPVPYASNIQLFLSKCISLKMTTAHPEPDSYQVLQLWRLLCVAVGVVLPSTNYLLEYLKAHLRRVIAIDYKCKIIRKQEAACARYCLKTLRRTLSSAPRRSPPSCDEILFATKQSPMSIRLHALTGQFRANISRNSNISGIIGFAIFTVFGGVERALYGDEKIADVLYKCEKEAALGSTFQKLKKSLSRAQAIEEIRTDSFPLSLDDSIHAAALCAQALYGECEDSELEEFMNRHFSKRYISSESETLLMRKHAEFSGKSHADAKNIFMNLSAHQSYTNEIPGECWMAVSVRGSPLVTHTYDEILSCSPSKKSILLITESFKGTSKYVFTTDQATCIASLIRDYMEVLLRTSHYT